MIRWISRVWRALRLAGEASTAANPRQWLIDWMHGEHGSDAGIRINGRSALRYAPVWYAVRRISGHVAQLPLTLYQRTGDRSKARAAGHPAYSLMRRRPNRAMNQSVFRELLQYHALVYGAGRAVIVRNQRGDAVELVPLLPESTKTAIVNGEKWHLTKIVVDQSGRTVDRKFRDEDVLHIVGLGYDGITGVPLWELAKNSWGLGLATEKHGNRHFANNATPGLILQAPQGVLVDETEARSFLQQFRSAQEGLDNVSKTALLRNGVTVSKLSSTGQESQWIEQRKFQRQEVSLWFLLEAITGDDGASYNSLEQKHLAYLVNCLNGWLVKWQEECEEKLLREREKLADSHYFRFNTGALLRSDTKTTYETLTMGVRGMLMTINEARDLLDLDAITGGDQLLNPAITPGPAIKNRMVEMCQQRLSELLAVEQRRVLDLLSRPDSSERLDAFYADWPGTLAGGLSLFTDDRVSVETLAAQWCRESRESLRRNSVEQQRDVVAAWPDRIRPLAEQLADEFTTALKQGE